jgi:hypothetical protein
MREGCVVGRGAIGLGKGSVWRLQLLAAMSGLIGDVAALSAQVTRKLA